LRAGNFRLLDTQFVTDHLKTFGAIEVSRRQYHKLLEAAVVAEADFCVWPADQPMGGDEALRRATA
jgi:leucyl/phenylalanyl-tRNA--protein transferase